MTAGPNFAAVLADMREVDAQEMQDTLNRAHFKAQERRLSAEPQCITAFGAFHDDEWSAEDLQAERIEAEREREFKAEFGWHGSADE